MVNHAQCLLVPFQETRVSGPTAVSRDQFFSSFRLPAISGKCCTPSQTPASHHAVPPHSVSSLLLQHLGKPDLSLKIQLKYLLLYKTFPDSLSLVGINLFSLSCLCSQGCIAPRTALIISASALDWECLESRSVCIREAHTVPDTRAQQTLLGTLGRRRAGLPRKLPRTISQRACPLES